MATAGWERFDEKANAEFISGPPHYTCGAQLGASSRKIFNIGPLHEAPQKTEKTDNRRGAVLLINKIQVGFIKGE